MLYRLDSSGQLYGTLLDILVNPMKPEGACTVLRMVSKFNCTPLKYSISNCSTPRLMSFTGNVRGNVKEQQSGYLELF